MENQDRPPEIADESAPMPVLFVGHGSPMNAIEDNVFSKEWRAVAAALPRPRAILCVSAHWESDGTRVTAMEKPRTIHDFGGFPRALYEVEYPAPGSVWLAQRTRDAIGKKAVAFDTHWGLDHGTWSVIRQMFPEADIPVVQLSLDRSISPREHYDLGKMLAPLRREGILIVGSGNLVHNLGLAVVRGYDFNEPFAFDWALEANDLFKHLIDANDHEALADYRSLGRAAQLAVPTPEHYLPMLYAIALRGDSEKIAYFNDQPVAGSLTMTSLKIGSQG